MSDNCNNVIRVLHMIGCLEIGGSQSMIMNIYRNIDRRIIQFDFVIDKDVKSPLYKEITQLGGKIYKMPKFNGINIIEVQSSWKKFFENHPEYKILHSHVRSYASIYLPIAKKFGLKTIIHSHSTSNGTGLASLVKRVMQFPLRYQADYLFACSKEAGEWLFGKKIIDHSNFIIIPNAIDTKKFKFNEEARERIRNELKINNKFVVGHIGRHASPKNPIFLLKLFAEIYKAEPNARLLQVGQGELTNQMKEECDKLGIADKVIFTGSRDDIPDLLSAMDVFVFPSLWEGLGMVAVEAQANGLNVIASDAVPPLADIGAGIFHYMSLNQSAEEWAEKILKYANNKRCEKAVEIAKNVGWDIYDTTVKLKKMYCNILNEQA